MSHKSPIRDTVSLDPETKFALEEGLRLADADPRRWTPAEVRADAKRMASEWREKITPPLEG